MSHIFLVPATTYDRAVVRRLWSRIDQIEGYPRTHALDEPGWQIGSAVKQAPRTETEWSALVRDGVVALFTGEVPAKLLARRITYSSTTRTLGQWLDQLTTNRGWQLVAELPGDPEEWQPVPVRDGAAGSADGVPIPAGEE